MRPLIIAILILICFATKVCGEVESTVGFKKIEKKEEKKKSPLEAGACVGLLSLFIYLIIDKWAEDNLKGRGDANDIKTD